MLKSRFVLLIAVAAVLSLLATGHVGRADDQKPEKAERPVKAVKPRSPKIEDVLTRATIWAKKTGHELKGFARVTVVQVDVLDEDNLLTVIEFCNGSIGIYEGSSDAAEDRCILLPKAELDLLKEIIARADRRS